MGRLFFNSTLPATKKVKLSPENDITPEIRALQQSMQASFTLLSHLRQNVVAFQQRLEAESHILDVDPNSGTAKTSITSNDENNHPDSPLASGDPESNDGQSQTSMSRK